MTLKLIVQYVNYGALDTYRYTQKKKQENIVSK